MTDTTFATALRRHIRRLNGSTLEWDISEYRETVDAVRRRHDSFVTLSDDALAARMEGYRERIRSGEEPDTLLVPVFALTIEAIRRELRVEPFDEQIVCGIILHRGKCAQMRTGEGKTLAAVFPAVLNALTGKGVHILTFNDYLARRDARWMGPVYRRLGITVGFVQESMSTQERRDAYRRDVTCLTAKEAGFDYLRDHCSYDELHTVHREFNFAIVDEADSVLIDEARIPLVIATASGEADNGLSRYATLARQMQPDRHFTFDMYGRKLSLTDEGADFAERDLACGDLYAPGSGIALVRLYHALHAQYLLHPNVDYLVRGNRIELIDELTGRVPENRRWPDGLQGAVEAKEGCPVQPRGAVRNTLAMHHFLALYPKLAGMTATAESAEEELHKQYGLDTVLVPPHRPCIRTDEPDLVFRTEQEKQSALVDEIATVHATGRPVLVGTRTVRESEELAARLRDAGIGCRILNAKDNEYEAAIIAEAGGIGAVTISTNMAGRGTDIRPGGSDETDRERVAARGGLYVIGTNRFESRRIDDQLRGRSGRQGDPGSSRFFISLEDKLFVKYRIADLIPGRFITADDRGVVGNRYVLNEVDRCQRIIEGQNSDIKLTLARYTSLIEQQRRIVATYREKRLKSNGLPEPFSAVVETGGDHDPGRATVSRCRNLLLATLDRHWSRYLADMADIRDGIHLRRFGRQDPLFEFNAIAIEHFAALISNAEQEAVAEYLSWKEESAPDDPPLHPSATWTYMVSDNPFEDDPDMQLFGNTGYSLFAGILWPFTMLILLLKKGRRRKS
ncbi:MAG: accessory Sec system translocase SecA2 [Chitinispirillaceae bacterium]|nr:accessory Sec system translocase SecA2 [Chitinispirillaceae bacterium]